MKAFWCAICNSHL